MQIVLRKISDARHELDVVRKDGRRDRVECETRSFLVHDLLHFAVESEAGLSGGFWGNLAKGKTLAELNDRAGEAMMAAESEEAALVERVVSVLTGAVKGRTAEELVTQLVSHAPATGWTPPGWLTAEFVERVQERMRRLLGHWKATPYRGEMRLEWPDP
ncbi:uncharacterized protein SOCE26_031040 [Sorangium cellulosum]|uniref:Uncharacterized protein n=1 Tax=Sorangium cellulosum TaxID=56 RepID=A0A2L0ER01_SORCE|nr:hypothetical protein [Sorangium cellulosum]AUX41682.1 uncharacterized protein SOCE26_031040 [Sorangium cellulosum]